MQLVNILRNIGNLPSTEGRAVFASNSELKRWVLKGSVKVNGETCLDPYKDFEYIDEIVLHPKSKLKNTLAPLDPILDPETDKDFILWACINDWNKRFP